MEGDVVIINNLQCLVSDVIDTKNDRIEVFIAGTSYYSGFQIGCFDGDLFQMHIGIEQRIDDTMLP